MADTAFPDIHVAVKDEDPHLRSRTMPMKVLVLGYPRTGTSSMQRALEILGFGPCYHMRICMNEFPRDNEMWMEAFRAKYDGIGEFERKEWDQLLGQYSSVCDLPAIAFSPELMAVYPSAKVILTNRDADKWHKSMSDTLLQARWYWVHEALQYFDWITALVHPLRKKYWKSLFDDDFEANGKAAMQDHYAEVRDLAGREGRDILEMELSDGWEPLCKFLAVDVPPIPYPRTNDGGNWTLKMKERARLRAKAAAIRFSGFSLPAIVVILGLWSMKDTLKTKGSWIVRSLL